MSTTRKIEGQARPMGETDASFIGKGFDWNGKDPIAKGYEPATLIIGGKGFTEDEVKALLMEVFGDDIHG